MRKKIYQIPEYEIEKFNNSFVISTSSIDGDGSNDTDYGDGGFDF